MENGGTGSWLCRYDDVCCTGNGISLTLEQSLGRDSRMLVLVDRH